MLGSLGQTPSSEEIEEIDKTYFVVLCIISTSFNLLYLFFLRSSSDTS